MTVRTSPAARTAELLEVALRLAAAQGWNAITRDDIALAAGVSPGLVSARLGTMDAMRRSVMRAAVTRGLVAIVAQGLAVRDRHALRASDELRAAAAAYVRS
jgi:AcrR family transcriptional regulator